MLVVEPLVCFWCADRLPFLKESDECHKIYSHVDILIIITIHF